MKKKTKYTNIFQQFYFALFLKGSVRVGQLNLEADWVEFRPLVVLCVCVFYRRQTAKLLEFPIARLKKQTMDLCRYFFCFVVFVNNSFFHKWGTGLSMHATVNVRIEFGSFVHSSLLSECQCVSHKGQVCVYLCRF